jgi:hypothetical protein
LSKCSCSNLSAGASEEEDEGALAAAAGAALSADAAGAAILPTLRCSALRWCSSRCVADAAVTDECGGVDSCVVEECSGVRRSVRSWSALRFAIRAQRHRADKHEGGIQHTTLEDRATKCQTT